MLGPDCQIRAAGFGNPAGAEGVSPLPGRAAGFGNPAGAEGIVFGKKCFEKLLKDIAHLPFEKQQEMLIHTFEAYKGGNDRLDDVTVGGVRI